MAKKQYLDYAGLTTYDEQIKSYIDTADAATSTKLTSGDIVVKEAEHATSADSATNADKASDADKLGGQLPSYYAKASDIPTGALANKDTVSESDLDSALAEKVNAAAEGNHSHSNKTVIDGITAAKVSAWDSAEANAKSYADSAAAAVKNDLLNGAGTAYDTLKELGDLIDDNVDAIEALEAVAAGKADAEHDHAIADVTGLQTALDAKAAQSSLDSHTGNTTVHITATERTNWNAAKTHADSAHAPSNAQPNQNAFSNVKVGTTTVAADTTTDTIEFAGTNVTITPDTTNDKVTFAVADGTTGAKGVVQLNSATNSTSETLAATPKAVKSAYDLANTAKTNAATAQSTADGAATTASEAKSAAAANTQSITAHTSSINTHTSQISALQGLVGEGTEAIPTASITALFA